MFTLTIKTDNAAFGDDPRSEIIRILVHIAGRMEATSATEGRIGDHNGNTVGDWTLTD